MAGKYCKNPKVPGAQLKVNPARAITWFVVVTTYCTFFNNISLTFRQFLCNKILLKKISYTKGQWCRSLLSIGGDNLQFYPNFALFSTLGGMNLNHDFVQVWKFSEDQRKKKVLVKIRTLFFPKSK